MLYDKFVSNPEWQEFVQHKHKYDLTPEWAEKALKLLNRRGEKLSAQQFYNMSLYDALTSRVEQLEEKIRKQEAETFRALSADFRRRAYGEN